MALFEVENLSVTYAGADSAALSGVTFEAKRSETVAVIGGSGSGKTTLLRALKASVRPKCTLTGKVRFDGNGDGDIGFLFQNPTDQTVCDTVFEELCFSMQNAALPPCDIRLRAAEVSAFFGLNPERRIGSLSGGEVMMVNLAAAAASAPAAILLDEPFSQLDPISCDRLITALKKLKNELGTTLIISSHSLSGILDFTDRVMVLEGGRIIKNGAPEKVLLSLKAEGNRLYKTAGELAGLSEDRLITTLSEAREELIKSKYAFRRLCADKSEGEVLLSAKHIYMRYAKTSPDVLKNACLTVRQGEILGICGANGSGKTTLLSVLSGVKKPYGGKVKGEAAYIPQDARCAFFKETVREDIEYMCKRSGIPLEKIDEAQREYKMFSNIGGILDRHPYDLSGGEVQTAAIFKAAVCQKKVLLMDEPAKGLDPEAKESFIELLRELKQSRGIVISSHDMELLAAVCDEVSMMFNGETTPAAPTAEFMQKNSFYTTLLARASRGILDGLILGSQIEGDMI